MAKAKKKEKNPGGRPPADISEHQLEQLMRLKPTLEDTAAFFKVSTSTIEKMIKRKYGISYSVFRQQRMVHTRFSLIRTAIQKAEKGDNCMLIFCLKNLCGWVDRPEKQDESIDEMEFGDE